VLDAIANERGQFAAVELDGDFDLHFASRNDEEPPHVVGQIEMIGRSIKIQSRGVEGAHSESSDETAVSEELSRESYLWLKRATSCLSIASISLQTVGRAVSDPLPACGLSR
jgi:hypothetical protein